jgi:hypothetical protein
MRTVTIALSVMLMAGGSARAEIKNTFGFDIMKPKRSKCMKVTGALQKKLEKSYTCEQQTADSPGSASGKPIAATCTAKGKTRSTYLLFASDADCREERETQLANGDG